MNVLGASWRPKVVAILSGIGPTGLFFLLTRYANMSVTDAGQISAIVFSILVALGFASTKQDGVSNSPTPLSVAQTVVPVAEEKPYVSPVPLAHPVPVASAPQPLVEPPNTLRK